VLETNAVSMNILTTVTAEEPSRPVVDSNEIRASIDAQLSQFLCGKSGEAACGLMHEEVPGLLTDFVFAGGKCTRSLLCVVWWGWYAAGGTAPPSPAVLRVAASLEIFHGFALIHDDVMDRSLTRRGHPTPHREIVRRRAEQSAGLDGMHVGLSLAVLIGDLALVWADELVHAAGLEPRLTVTVQGPVNRMPNVVMYGQYLDVSTAGRPCADVELALRIARYKTVTYTCERPLHIGACLNDADAALLKVLSGFAPPIGEAFQLRDDLLGVFGDPQVTGKPLLAGFRERKPTALVAVALQRSSRAQQRSLRDLFTETIPDDVMLTRLRRLPQDTGAREAIEQMITERRSAALRCLDHATLPPHADQALRRLAEAATRRSS
jgi:geranylgeranyl diphosphate synthase type I